MATTIAQPPLTYEASANVNQPTSSTSLPPEVVTCLRNARFLHLATCANQVPHVSLMSYTYLPATPFSSSPTIVMTMNPSSQKTSNLRNNPRVSLLVHDWVSHRPPTRVADPGREGSPPPAAGRSSLAAMLLNMNTSELSRISTTINGEAYLLDVGSEEEKWCKEMHLDNNTFSGQPDSTALLGTSTTPDVSTDSRGSFITREDIQVVAVKIKDGRIADWKGGVKDWVIAESNQDGPLVNGV